jgi:hypothetical protein
MRRSTRIAAALLLAGLVQVSLPSAVSAQNIPWRFATSVDPITDDVFGDVSSGHFDGGYVIFGCAKGGSLDNFFIIASTQKFDSRTKRNVKISWRVDNGPAREEIWEAETSRERGGNLSVGRSAYEFALAVGGAQRRIVFRDPNGTVVFDAKGSTKAVRQLLKHCEFEQ